MIYFFDLNKELIKVIGSQNVINAAHEHELNGAILGAVELDLRYAKEFIEDSEFFGYFYEDIFYMHKIRRVEETHEDEHIAVIGRHIFFDELLTGELIQDTRPRERDAVYTINNTIGKVTDWTAYSDGTTKHLDSSFYWDIPMEALDDIVNDFQIDYLPVMQFDGKEITSKKIFIDEKLGDDTGIRVPFGSRVLSLKHEVDYDGIVTKLFVQGRGEEVGDGYGRRINIKDVEFERDGVVSPNGDYYMYSDELIKEYGIRHGKEIFEDIEDVDELAESAYEFYIENSRPRMLFTAEVAQLGKVNIGDTVNIIRREHELYFKARVHKINVNLLYPEDVKIELGDYEHFKESKSDRVERRKNEQKQAETDSRIESLKRQFDVDFEAEVEELIKEFEQAKIDAFAEIEAMEHRFNEKMKAEIDEFNKKFQELVDNAYQLSDEEIARITEELKTEFDGIRGEMQERLGAFENEDEKIWNKIDDILGEIPSLTEDEKIADGIKKEIEDLKGEIDDIHARPERERESIREEISEEEQRLSNLREEIERIIDERNEDYRKEIAEKERELEEFKQTVVERIDLDKKAKQEEIERAEAEYEKFKREYEENIGKRKAEYELLIAEYKERSAEFVKLINDERNKHVERLRGEIADNENSIVELEKSIEEQKRNAIEETKTEYEQQIKQYEETRDYYIAERDKHQAEIERLENEIKEIENELNAGFEKELSEWQSQLDELVSQKEIAEQKVNDREQELQSEYETDLKQLKEDLSNKTTDRDTELERLETEREELVAEYEERIADIKQEIEDKYKSDTGEYNAEKRRLESEIADLENKIEEIKSNNAKVPAEIDEKERQLKEYQDERTRVQNEIRSIKDNYDRRYREYTDTINRLTSRKSNLQSAINYEKNQVNANHSYIRELESEISTIDSQIRTNQSARNNLSNDTSRQERRVSELNDLINNLTQTINNLKTQIQEIDQSDYDQLDTLQSQLANLTQPQRDNSQLNQLQAEIEELQSQPITSDLLERLNQAIDELQTQIDKLTPNKIEQSLLDELERVKQLIEEHNSKKPERPVNDEIESLRSQIDELQSLDNSDEVNELNDNIERVKQLLETVEEDTLRDLTFEETEQIEQLNQSITGLNERIEELLSWQLLTYEDTPNAVKLNDREKYLTGYDDILDIYNQITELTNRLNDGLTEEEIKHLEELQNVINQLKEELNNIAINEEEQSQLDSIQARIDELNRLIESRPLLQSEIEQIETLNALISQLNRKLGNVSDNPTTEEQQILDGLNSQIGGLNSDLFEVQKRINPLIEDVYNLEEVLTEVKRTQDGEIRKLLETKQDIDKYSRRLVSVETTQEKEIARVGTIEHSVNSISGQFKELTDDLNNPNNPVLKQLDIKAGYDGFYVRNTKVMDGQTMAGYLMATHNQVSAGIKNALTENDVTINDNGIKIGSKSLTGSQMASSIVVSPYAIDLISKNVNIDGNLNVLGTIKAEAAKVAKAEIGEAYISKLTSNVVDTHHLKADSVTATKLKVDTAMANKLIANYTISNHIETKSIDAVKGQFGSLFAQYIKSAVIEADQLKAGTALFDKVFSSDAMIRRLTSQSAFIRDIQAIDITVDRLTSSRGTDTFVLTGNQIKWNRSDGNNLEMSIDGFYMRNSSGRILYRMDKQLVTTSAFGTSNANAYVGTKNGYEVRFVDATQLPSDGLVDSYRYSDARGKYSYFDGVAPNQGTHLWLGADGEIRFSNKGFTTYNTVRGAAAYFDYISMNAINNNANNFYIKARPGYAVHFVDWNDRGFVDIQFKEWRANSYEKDKHDISDWEYNVLDDFRNKLQLKKYKFNTQDDDEFRHGIVIREDESQDEFPKTWRSGTSFNGNEVMWWNTKAIQELAHENDSLKSEIKELNNKIDKIMEMIA